MGRRENHVSNPYKSVFYFGPEGYMARIPRPQALSLRLVVSVFAACMAIVVHAQDRTAECGLLVKPGQFGPFDYRTAKDKLTIVEPYHFTPPVEALIKSINGKLGSDIGYTLQRFPNHHRALVSLMRLGERQGLEQPDGEEFTVECRLERAVRFAKDDVIARMLYAEFLTRRNRKPEAMYQLETVYRTPDLSAFSQANLGLIYFQLDEFDRAIELAKSAKAAGLQKSLLYERLRAAGRSITVD